MTQSKTLILTGASDGIGKALALEFARRGYSLGLIARRLELLEAVRAECLTLGSEAVLIAAVDVTRENDFEAALNTLDDGLKGAEYFVANAGVTGRSCFDENAWPSVKHTFQVNILAAVHGLEVMKVKMLKRGRGTLVGVSSVAGSRGMPTSGGYSSSKAALTTHLETLRVDLRRRGLSVVTVAPGFIDTPLTKLNRGTMPFLMQPDAAAFRFANGIEKKKAFVVTPRPYRLLYPILQLLPRAWFDFILDRAYGTIRG